MNLGRHPFSSCCLFLAALLSLCASCTKDITIDLPDQPEELVVEGIIEPGAPPYVILSHTESYGAPYDPNSNSRFVTGAAVTVTTDGNVWTLDEECSDQMDPASMAAIAELTGLSPLLTLLCQHLHL